MCLIGATLRCCEAIASLVIDRVGIWRPEIPTAADPDQGARDQPGASPTNAKSRRVGPRDLVWENASGAARSLERAGLLPRVPCYGGIYREKPTIHL